MLDFKSMQWERTPGVVLESERVPDTWTPGRAMRWHSSPAVVVRSADGRVESGTGDGSMPTARPGDLVTLLDSGRFDLDVISGLPGGRTVRLQLEVSFATPEVCAAQFTLPNQVTQEAFALRLGGSPSFHAALREAGLPGTADQVALHNSLARMLADDFGLVVHTLGTPEVGQEAAAFRARAGLVVHDHWRLERPLGSGSFGDVWLAVHTHNSEDRRAVKFPPLDDPGARRMLAREAQAAVRLSNTADHTHLAVLHEFWPEPLALHYEYIEGTSLRNFVAERGGKLPPEEAVRLTEELLLGVEQLHQVRPHRDLHPGNLMVEARTGRLKIIDYGLMLPPEASSPYASYLTHPLHAFAEPLPRRGSADIDARTDLYSVGLLLWWMLTSSEQLPVGRTFADAAPAVTPSLLAVAERACQLDRSQSFDSAEEMWKALQANPAAGQSGTSQVDSAQNELATEIIDAVRRGELPLLQMDELAFRDQELALRIALRPISTEDHPGARLAEAYRWSEVLPPSESVGALCVSAKLIGKYNPRRKFGTRWWLCDDLLLAPSGRSLFAYSVAQFPPVAKWDMKGGLFDGSLWSLYEQNGYLKSIFRNSIINSYREYVIDMRSGEHRESKKLGSWSDRASSFSYSDKISTFDRALRSGSSTHQYRTRLASIP